MFLPETKLLLINKIYGKREKEIINGDMSIIISGKELFIECRHDTMCIEYDNQSRLMNSLLVAQRHFRLISCRVSTTRYQLSFGSLKKKGEKSFSSNRLLILQQEK